MLLGNYASDSEGSDDESGPAPVPLAAKVAPPPTAAAAVGKPKRKGPVKITLDLPKSTPESKAQGDRGGLSPSGDDEENGREIKRAKTGLKSGKGSSALLGMLPPPKRKLPTSKSTPSLPPAKAPKVKPAANLPAPPGHIPSGEGSDSDDNEAGLEDPDEKYKSKGIMLPPSLQRQAKVPVKKEASLDLFGLGDETEAGPSSSSTKKPSMSISSAPTVVDYIPPPPGPNDPYPGYYQTPSGQWQAYDTDYYHSFFPSSDSSNIAGEPQDGDGGDGRVGRHWEEFNSKGADFIDIDVSKGLEEGRLERERRERATKPKTGEEVEYKAVGQIKGLATERHQLSALLNTAFTQKEELEQRIANNKKSARMASQKYGF